MITVIRILYGILSFGILLFGGMHIGVRLTHNDPEYTTEKAKSAALGFNTMLLAVFFTLWCVKMGIV